LLWLACIPFGVFHGTNIAFPSDRLVVFFVAIVIVFTLLFYVFSREMRSLNKAIKDIDDFMGKERTE
jgi:hypothetical protein